MLLLKIQRELLLLPAKLIGKTKKQTQYNNRRRTVKDEEEWPGD